MFSGFLNFFNKEIGYDIYRSEYRTFIIAFGGMQFGRGMFTVFAKADMRYWEENISRAFPDYRGTFQLFGHDWMGRCYAIDTYDEEEKILVFEPGTLEVFEIPLTFMDFINKAIPLNASETLNADAFIQWYKNVNQTISDIQCVGYDIPLFMGGEDTEDNYIVRNLDEYWRYVGSTVPQDEAEYDEDEDVDFGEHKLRLDIIKKNVDYYTNKFKKMDAKDTNLSWNWCAFFFPFEWLAYRKRYGLAAFLYILSMALMFVAGFGIEMLKQTVELDVMLQEVIVVIPSFILLLIVGMFGNSWYRNKVEKLIDKGLEAETYEEREKVVKKGGTSIVAIIIVLIITIGVEVGLDLLIL